jgi:hypothetical protein
MDTAKLDFIQNKFLVLVSNLPATAKGNWGKMNGQQMVEHVTAFFKVSSNKINFPLITPTEHLPKFKEFLLSDAAFRENTKAPTAILGDEPLPLRNSNMNEAIEKLQKSINEFVDYFTTDANQTTMHPVFGNLNFEEWILLHYKHVTHHARQFGL